MSGAPVKGWRGWTPAELKALRTCAATRGSYKALAAKLDRSVVSVRSKALDLGLIMKRPWSDADDYRLHLEYAMAEDLDVLAKSMARSRKTLVKRASELGLRRAAERVHEDRVKGGAASVAVRREKARLKAVRATPLDAAWRGLLTA